jgi:hypothetical protein
LCVEVKSHDQIRFADDRWYPSSITRSPFKQIRDGLGAFHRAIKQLAPYTTKIPQAGLCVFPFARFDVRNVVSVLPDELIDGQEFDRLSKPEDFCAELERRMRTLSEKEGRWLEETIPAQRVENLVSLCLPIQQRRPDAGEELRERQRKREEALRAQQRPLVRMAELNDRLFVSGGAGTGKTLIAFEIARRRAEAGERVALVTFNRLVGSWLRGRAEHEVARPTLIADSVHRLLLQMMAIDVPERPDDTFWDAVPEKILERLTDPEFQSDAMFDYLVVDEAQDILARPELWTCLTALVRGGSAKGRFALFGDVDHQVLTGRTNVTTATSGLRESGGLAVWELTENCRNPSDIGRSALLLSRLPADLYTSYARGGGNSTGVSLAVADSEQERIQTVLGKLAEVRAAGFKSHDIVFLSFSAPEHSLARALIKRGETIYPAGDADHGMSYSSVHAFKGMEKRVVFITDIDLSKGDQARDLLYTALTRATERVCLLAGSDDAKRLTGWLLEDAAR